MLLPVLLRATLRPSQIDWSSIGAMLGGVGAVAAALGTLVLIALTRRYVQINAELLELNRDTLSSLQQSVQESNRQAEAATRSAELLAQQWAATQREKLEPVQVALTHATNMLEDFIPQLTQVDELGSLGPDIRPDWFLPDTFVNGVERARHVSTEL